MLIFRFVNWLRSHQSSIESFWSPLSTVVANTTIIATLIIALASYFQAQHLGRTEASLNYMNAFRSGQVQEAQNLIYQTWLPYDFSGATHGLSPKAVEALIERVIPNETTAEGIEYRLAIASIVSFFDSAMACAEQGVCDRGTLYSQIGGYGRDFFCLYRSVIADERSRGRMTSFGDGLTALSADIGGC